jgi:hypothetical protein
MFPIAKLKFHRNQQKSLAGVLCLRHLVWSMRLLTLTFAYLSTFYLFYGWSPHPSSPNYLSPLFSVWLSLCFYMFLFHHLSSCLIFYLLLDYHSLYRCFVAVRVFMICYVHIALRIGEYYLFLPFSCFLFFVFSFFPLLCLFFCSFSSSFLSRHQIFYCSFNLIMYPFLSNASSETIKSLKKVLPLLWINKF